MAARRFRDEEIACLTGQTGRNGEPVFADDIRRQRQHDLERLDAGVKRIMTPHIYHVSLTRRLWNLKQELINSFKSTTVPPQ